MRARAPPPRTGASGEAWTSACKAVAHLSIFEWNNGAQTEDISGLLPGTYVVMITDVNGCTLPDSAMVSGSPAFIADAAVTNNACNESTIGAIDLSVLSGTAPYLFDWSTGANTEDLSGLASNTYAIAITDAAGCSWTNTYIVGQGSEITADSLVLELPERLQPERLRKRGRQYQRGPLGRHGAIYLPMEQRSDLRHEQWSRCWHLQRSSPTRTDAA